MQYHFMSKFTSGRLIVFNSNYYRSLNVKCFMYNGNGAVTMEQAG